MANLQMEDVLRTDPSPVGASAIRIEPSLPCPFVASFISKFVYFNHLIIA